MNRKVLAFDVFCVLAGAFMLTSLICINVSYRDLTVPIPQDGKCYASAGFLFDNSESSVLSDISGQISNFTRITGKGIYAYFDAWGDRWVEGEPFWQIQTMDAPGVFPHGQNNFKPLLANGSIEALGLIVWPCLRDNETYDSHDDNVTIHKIANGEFDAFIIAQAIEIKNFGYPVFIRFGSEFNINQGSQSYLGAFSFGENPTDFVKAWQRYVSIFRIEHAINAIFIWNPNWEDLGPHNWAEYYPGNNYVDWVGIDLYQYDPNSQPAQMMQGIYNDYCNQKPIAVIEWGTNWVGQNYSDDSRAKFVNAFFDAVEARPQIKMINYWYCLDFRFNSTAQPLTTQAYINRISNARYIT